MSFALAELSYGACEVDSVRVENFKQQVGSASVSVVVVCYCNVTEVVAGIIYSFDLVTSGGCWAGHEASSCSMSVFSQPWTQTLQVNWDSSTCDQPE